MTAYSDLDQAMFTVGGEPGEQPRITASSLSQLPAIRSTTTARAVPAAYLLKAPQEWGVEDLREYVLTEIQRRLPVLRDSEKDHAVIKAFMKRWPDGAGVQIARHAFADDGLSGWWRNAFIDMRRFMVKSDPYFAVPIAQKLGLARP